MSVAEGERGVVQGSAPRTRCECGACRRCKRRAYLRKRRQERRDEMNAYNKAWMQERRAGLPGRRQRSDKGKSHKKKESVPQKILRCSYAITLDDAEQMDMEEWLRLPEQVRAGIVGEYVRARALG